MKAQSETRNPNDEGRRLSPPSSVIRHSSFVILLLLTPLLRAADAVADPDLPQPVTPEDVTPLITSSPFTRSLNLSDSLVLTGIAYIEGKPVATLLNKETKENFVVAEVPNAQGMRLAETSATVQLSRTQAKIMVGTEVVTVRYSDEQLTPEAMKKGGFKPGGGGPPGGDGRYDGPRRDGPRPSDEERAKFMEKFSTLTDRGKEKFGEAMRNSREKMMNASPEERSNYVRKVFEKVQEDDKGGGR